MFDQVWSRPNDAHVAAQHVPELRHFVDAQFAKPFAQWINTLIGRAGLTRDFAIAGMHRPKLVNLELSILHSGALLHVKKWTWRLESLRDENDCSQDRKDYQHDRKRDREIDCALNKPVQRVFQRLLAQTDEPKPAIFEMRHRVAQPFLQVAQDEKTNAELVANLNHILVCFGEKRKLEQDDLSDAVIANDIF